MGTIAWHTIGSICPICESIWVELGVTQVPSHILHYLGGYHLLLEQFALAYLVHQAFRICDSLHPLNHSGDIPEICDVRLLSKVALPAG